MFYLKLLLAFPAKCSLIGNKLVFLELLLLSLNVSISAINDSSLIRIRKKNPRSIFFLVIHQTFLVTDINISRSEKMLLSQCTHSNSISPWGRQYITHFQFELLLYFLLAGRGTAVSGKEGAAFQLSQHSTCSFVINKSLDISHKILNFAP